MPAGRAVVIGAGHNGLVCGINLAAAGVPVTVVEQGPRAGGGVDSSQVTLPGFEHDHCAGFFPVSRASPAMRELPLERLGVEWVNPSTPVAHPFLDGSAICLHRDVEATAASLSSVAPGSGDGWRELMELLLPVADTLGTAIFTRFPPISAALRLAPRLGREGVMLARRGAGSAEAFGLDLFGHDRPTAWLCASAMHSGLEPRASASGAFGFLLMLLGHSVGWPFPRGGAGRLRDALVALLEEHGGELRCNSRVERILVSGGRAAGVSLAGGEELAANAVVATVTAGPLAAMVPDGALPERIIRRLERWRYGTGVFKVDFALEQPVPWTAAEARSAGVVHLGGELAALTRSAQESNRGVTPEEPSMVVGQHSLFDDTRAPEGRHTLYSYAHVPSIPPGRRGPHAADGHGLPHPREVDDEEVAERMERQLERFAPGFRDLVLARHIRSPERLAEENPSMVGGDLAGGSFEIDQQLVFRPTPELVRHRTPLPGLYLGSASVHPGGAAHGACGQGAARSLLEDRSWRSPLASARRLRRALAG